MKSDFAGPRRRWDPCIEHHGADVDDFFRTYFSGPERVVLFVCGVGFDPRSTAVGLLLATTGCTTRALFIREIRPTPSTALSERADRTLLALTTAFPAHELVDLEIFGPDGAVVGGRNTAAHFAKIDLEGITDVVVDVSGLSVGTSFPAVRQLLNRIGGSRINLHVAVAHDPVIDDEIEVVASDSPGYVHGFRGTSGLDDSSAAARLWLPQLARGRRATLSRLFDFVGPHDTCPILPWPAKNPRFGDELAEHFQVELEDVWLVDARNIVYAAEDDPLDLYRTILRLDDLRRPVFAGFGGSLVILSPIGSKAMALGALMAALERDLPVAYLESNGYVISTTAPVVVEKPRLLHVWLEGTAYPDARTVTFGGGNAHRKN